MAPSASRSTPTDSKSRGNHLFAGLDSDNEGGDDGPAFTSAFTPVNKNPRRSQRRVLRAVSIETPGDFDRDEYDSAKVDWAVRKVLREVPGKNEVFQVLFEDGTTRTVSYEPLLDLRNGPKALEAFHLRGGEPDSDEESEEMVELRRSATKRKAPAGFVSTADVVSSEDEDHKLRRNGRSARNTRRSERTSRSTRQTKRASTSEEESQSEDSEESGRRRKSRRLNKPSRTAANQSLEEEEEELTELSDETLDLLESDVMPRRSRHKSLRAWIGKPSRGGRELREATRKSERATRHQNNMEEAGMDDIYRSDSEPRHSISVVPKATGAKEAFKEVSQFHPFRRHHVQGCETCGRSTGPFIYCQGCTLSYHRSCLGPRSIREHLVTKVDDGDFVLQCRRCVNLPRRKEQTAPDLAKCHVCNETNPSSDPFRVRKSAMQEQREREENDGEDPVTIVDPGLINNPRNVIFRCLSCWRGFHFHHLPSRSVTHMDLDDNEEDLAERRYEEYSRDWLCKDCVDAPGKISGIVAWRPVDLESVQPGVSSEIVDEDDKEYLIKWEKMSHFRAIWMPGAWVWGVAAPAMRRAFNKREMGPHMRTEDAIPEEYLRIDIVLDVKYTSIVDINSEEIDKARIKEVDEALIKYKGLGYEEAVWEKVPTSEDGDRWVDFVTAYYDWVAGRYIHPPKQHAMKIRLDKARAKPFSELEKQKQPESLVGGELMKYQLEGVNWLYYQWYSRNNGILADEMGLGKTIQIIGMLATLVQDHHCYPFLIVVPNSTCANWRREIQKWAPSLRVVAYFGSGAAKQMAHKYEMYPNNAKELCCHIVVTSYDAAADESSAKVLRRIPWTGMIVDEGHRLKNDRGLLYRALTSMKVPFRVLLTGTPLQNNARELFNLLHFLDPTKDAEALEIEYGEMTAEKLSRLHETIRPFILRRTKAQVLSFLPPMGQIILPVTMSVLQKKLYRSIIAQNPELLKALFTNNSRNTSIKERANLNNILMQLRKCLCHPFVYSKEIEERTDVPSMSHRNLIEASAKLQLLDILLPKLQERGHRVLIFSQFLDMLDIIEDFMDGLQMRYQRLDGNLGSLEKQKRIDEFNAPDSALFAFLLSTRAGGVGINLATADTVIILDPDFNPHQDIQALSRAHRIGQKKKVLCFQLMTRASAEEKIVQIGRKKMALDHVVIEQLDQEDIEEKDVESVLRHGAAELFADDAGEHDIKYDSASVEKLLDRSTLENTKAGADNSAESQFSFARIWANNSEVLKDNLDTPNMERAPDPSVWDKILKERERAAAKEAAAKAEALGRGRRARANVDYGNGPRDEPLEEGNKVEGEVAPDAPDAPTPVKKRRGRKRKEASYDESDTDFNPEGSEGEATEPEGAAADGEIDPAELQNKDGPHKISGIVAGQHTGAKKPKAIVPASRAPPSSFSRVPMPQLLPAPPREPLYPSHTAYAPIQPQGAPPMRVCPACSTPHPSGSCPLKLTGLEYCGLCGLAHYASTTTNRPCPHLNSETMVGKMLDAVKRSGEDGRVKEAALRYLKHLKGNLVSKKRAQWERRMRELEQRGGAEEVARGEERREREIESALLGYLGGASHGAGPRQEVQGGAREGQYAAASAASGGLGRGA